jgi:hypothetical protein
VDALAVFDDGSGPALYAAGKFTVMGGMATSRVARWSGSAWSTLGAGLDGPVSALFVNDDGSGPALVAAGAFSSAGGQPAANIARWRNGQWSPLGARPQRRDALPGLLRRPAPRRRPLHGLGSTAAAHIAAWNGSAWTGVGAPPGVNDDVLSLCVYDDGSGARLYAGGHFTMAGNVTRATSP